MAEQGHGDPEKLRNEKQQPTWALTCATHPRRPPGCQGMCSEGPALALGKLPRRSKSRLWVQRARPSPDPRSRQHTGAGGFRKRACAVGMCGGQEFSLGGCLEGLKLASPSDQKSHLACHLGPGLS